MNDDITTDGKYTTRGCLPARIYAIDGAGTRPVHGAVLRNEGWSLCNWTLKGKTLLNRDDIMDLVPVLTEQASA